jgi:hypothetical protein
MDEAPALPWGKMAVAAGGVVVAYLTFRGATALMAIAFHEARDRLNSGHLPKRWA